MCTTNTQVNLIEFSSTLFIHTFRLFYSVIHAGAVIGFTNLGEVNSHLEAYETSLSRSTQSVPSPATSMLVFMVRGLFSTLQFPYAQFPYCALSGDQLFEPFWERVSRLERIGFKVIGLSCDGLAANRRFFRLHKVNPSVMVCFTRCQTLMLVMAGACTSSLTHHTC